MGLEPINLSEQTQLDVSKNPITATVTDVSVDGETGTAGFNQGIEDFSQGFVGAETSLDAVRQGIGVTPISQGIVNEIVLDYHYKTGPFILKYSFSNDIKLPTGVIPKNTTFTTKNANYVGLTDKGQTISVETPTPVEVEDDKTNENRNRNKKIVDLFNTVNIKLGLKDPFVLYFRKNIRPILRRIKKELPEYGLNFKDQATKWEGDQVVTENFITIKDILLENYTESLKQLIDLNAAKEAQKKDKKMANVLDKEIEKEKKKLIGIIKPKFKKIFKEYTKDLTDDDLVNLITYFNVFLEGLKGSKLGYPQYNITFSEKKLNEEEEVDVEEVIETPKDMLIHLRDEQEVVFISRKYPCTVTIGGEQTGENTIFIMDATSRYIYKGGAKTTPQGSTTGDTKTKIENNFYTLPVYNQLQNDKGKSFDITMSIDIDPQVYLAKGNQHAALLQKHEGDLWKYKTNMLDNGFEIKEIKSSQGQTTKVPGDAKLRFLFSRGTENVEFGKKYQVTVLQDNNTLGKLNITIDKIKKETSGF